MHFREEEESEEEEEEENQENGESDGKKADEVVSQDYPMARYVKTSAYTCAVCYKKDAHTGLKTSGSQLVTDSAKIQLFAVVFTSLEDFSYQCYT